MKFFFDVCRGILIGAGAILPGISSGVLCVVFGFYEKLINSILGIFKDFKNSFKFLLPIAVRLIYRDIHIWKYFRVFI